MEIRLLEYFVAVCEELHFTKAAEKLNISQPSLSQQIRVLESRLGTQLFQRIGKKICITHAGEILLLHTQNIFSELNQVTNKIKELQEIKLGKITIGCAGNYMLHSTLLSFHKQFPGVEIALIDIPTVDIIKNVVENKFDIGIVYLPANEPSLKSKLLFKTEFNLVVSVENELADVVSIELESLQSKPLIFTPKTFFTRQTIDKYCKSRGFTLNPILELSDVNSLYQMTVHNKGITILPASFLKTINDKRIRKIPINDPIPLNEVGIIYKKDNIMSPALKSFIECLLNNTKKDFTLEKTRTKVN
jgi:LysR family transcriptional regulator, cyn operon transcriptional activator